MYGFRGDAYLRPGLKKLCSGFTLTTDFDYCFLDFRLLTVSDSVFLLDAELRWEPLIADSELRPAELRPDLALDCTFEAEPSLEPALDEPPPSLESPSMLSFLT